MLSEQMGQALAPLPCTSPEVAGPPRAHQLSPPGEANSDGWWGQRLGLWIREVVLCGIFLNVCLFGCTAS